MALLLLTLPEIIARVRYFNGLRSLSPGSFLDRSVTLPNIHGQVFYVLRVDDCQQQHYVEMLKLHPIARMPEWGVVDFLLNAEMEE